VITWTSEQQELHEAIQRRGPALSADHVDNDARAEFSWDKWDLIRESDLLALPFDTSWGGLGQGLPTTMYVLEGLGRCCRDGGLSFSVTTSMASTGVPLERFGSDHLKARYLPRICLGEIIGAHAITEPRGGSDALSMLTTAEPDGDDFLLNGSKTFVSNGPIADVLVVYARTHPSGGPLGITTFMVDRDTDGLSIGKPLSKMGLRTSPLSEIFFTDCRVPRSQIIGKVGMGYRILDYVMKREILFSFIVNVGEMQHRLEQCIEYARTRSAFGERIGSYQSIANKIVDMKIQLEMSRRLLYDTAVRLERGDDVTIDLAMSKLVTSRANVASGLDAIQIFGGYGYMSEYGLEKDVRNAIAGTIYSGTTEIQYNRIASMLGL
jgi:alkylation response protein AidB-like acyl-CoA dehydrogenase